MLFRYFQHIHLSLPIVDQDTFWNLWKNDRDKISPTLICNIYAITIPYWRSSEVLINLPPPDSDFAWNQAVAASQDDFTTPSITTVCSALINLAGRPAMEMRGNVLNVGRTVSLAHSLGLHRDPTHWETPEAEKQLRASLWWTILIHDSWVSLTHGTPPCIHSRNHNVPLPCPEVSSTSNRSAQTDGSCHTFVRLCALTQLLAEILPLIYAIRPECSEMQSKVQQVQNSLDVLEESSSVARANEDLAQGSATESANLRFCFLTVKMVLGRVAFKVRIPLHV